jgi:hypothetical protein
MTFSDPVDPAPRSFAGDLLYAVRYYFGGRIGLVAIAAAALGLGTYYNWGWLVAIGIAPILVSALPCVAMCALGLCMSGRSRNQANEPASTQNSPDESGGQSVLQLGAPLGEDQGGTDASDQPTSAAPRNRDGCC